MLISNMRILVTGAGGFVGGRLVEVLALSGHTMVRGLVRRWSSCTNIGRFPIEIVQADLLNEREICSAIEGVNCIVHCAYGPKGVTVKGTHNLLNACLNENIQKIIYLSTTAVYGSAVGIIDEKHVCKRIGNEYADSKLEAEHLCNEYIHKGLPVCILRLPIVYGPFSRNWTINIARMLLRGHIHLIEEIDNGKCNLLYIDDLLTAICICLKSDMANGNIFNINGKEIVSWNQYFKLFNEILGFAPLKESSLKHARMFAYSTKPVRAFGKYLRENHLDVLRKIAEKVGFFDRIMRSSEEKVRDSFCTADLEMFERDVVYSSSKAEHLLGFQPKTTLAEGLSASAAWLKALGFTWLSKGTEEPRIDGYNDCGSVARRAKVC